jgi:hypothetical protein
MLTLAIKQAKNAGPKFECPTHSGCQCCHWPLQTLRLPAPLILANKVQQGKQNGQKRKNH